MRTTVSKARARMIKNVVLLKNRDFYKNCIFFLLVSNVVPIFTECNDEHYLNCLRFVTKA